MTHPDLRQEAVSLLEDYISSHSTQVATLQLLRKQIKFDPQNVFSRSNLTGHITASMLVLDPTQEKVLMIEHPVYDKWIPPGGHVEPDCTSLWQAAALEAEQETGITAIKPLLMNGEIPAPFDIDTHPIAANARKQEGAHYHHDFMYLAQATCAFEPAPQPEDAVKNARWLSRKDLARLDDPRMQRLSRELDRLVPIDRLGLQEVMARAVVQGAVVVMGCHLGQFGIATREGQSMSVIDTQFYPSEKSARTVFDSIASGEKSVDEVFGYASPRSPAASHFRRPA